MAYLTVRGWCSLLLAALALTITIDEIGLPSNDLGAFFAILAAVCLGWSLCFICADHAEYGDAGACCHWGPYPAAAGPACAPCGDLQIRDLRLRCRCCAHIDLASVSPLESLTYR
jgi:hypothetical protein